MEKMNGRYATACQNDPQLKKQKEDCGSSKSEHRKASSAWIIDPTMGDVFRSLQYNVSATQTHLRKDIWQSKTTTLANWTEEELGMHLASGRFVAREDPRTKGVYEYKDLYNDESSKTILKNKTFQRTSSSHCAGGDAVEDMSTMDDVWKNAGSHVDTDQCWRDTGLEWLGWFFLVLLLSLLSLLPLPLTLPLLLLSLLPLLLSLLPLLGSSGSSSSDSGSSSNAVAAVC
jgi:hypothetical protein